MWPLGDHQQFQESTYYSAGSISQIKKIRQFYSDSKLRMRKGADHSSHTLEIRD